MTNEELFADLKQFIEATVSQQLAGVVTKDDLDSLRTELKTDITHLGERIARLDEKLDIIQDAIAETLTHTNEVTDVTLQDHERRLQRLEHRSA